MSDENLLTTTGEENEEVVEAPVPVDAKVVIIVSGDDMLATMTLIAPEHGGQHVSEDVVRTALKESHVESGLDWTTIKSMISPPAYDIAFAAAHGKAAVNGRDGELEYFIDIHHSLKPKQLEDGSVDHRELGIVNAVQKGQTLIERTPSTTGVEGFTVRGKVLKATNGKDVTIFGGLNTQVTEDRLKLIALKSGHVEYVNERVNVFDVFTINSDVSNETGNVKFDGSVVVNGSVRQGFTIEATGNITVRGGCEAANIIAGGSINIGEGANGGKITANVDVKCRYLQTCEVTAGKNIHATSIINCNIQCGVSVIISGGSRAALMGGSCMAGESLETMYIGSPSGKNRVVTRIEVGIDPTVLTRFKAATVELEQTRKNVENLDKVLNFLGQFRGTNRFDEDKEQKYDTAQYTREFQVHRRQELEQEIATLKNKLDESGFGKVIVRNGISEGTKFVIGPYSMAIENSMDGAKVVRGDEGILLLPLSY